MDVSTAAAPLRVLGMSSINCARAVVLFKFPLVTDGKSDRWREVTMTELVQRGIAKKNRVKNRERMQTRCYRDIVITGDYD